MRQVGPVAAARLAERERSRAECSRPPCGGRPLAAADRSARRPAARRRSAAARRASRPLAWRSSTSSIAAPSAVCSPVGRGGRSISPSSISSGAVAASNRRRSCPKFRTAASRSRAAVVEQRFHGVPPRSVAQRIGHLHAPRVVDQQHERRPLRRPLGVNQLGPQHGDEREQHHRQLAGRPAPPSGRGSGCRTAAATTTGATAANTTIAIASGSITGCSRSSFMPCPR